MLTYITQTLSVFFYFEKYADLHHPDMICFVFFILFKRSSHGPMVAYLMLHLQVGIRTQTRTQIAILSLRKTLQLLGIQVPRGGDPFLVQVVRFFKLLCLLSSCPDKVHLVVERGAVVSFVHDGR